MAALKTLIESTLKERSEPDRTYWFERGQQSDASPQREETPASTSEAMYWADEEADLLVGLLDQLGKAPCRIALGALREGVKSRLYRAYLARR